MSEAILKTLSECGGFPFFFPSLADSWLLQGHLLVIIRDKLLQFPGKRMEAVISPEFVARGGDKEEIWAGVKASKTSARQPRRTQWKWKCQPCLLSDGGPRCSLFAQHAGRVIPACTPDCFSQVCDMLMAALYVALLKRLPGLRRRGPPSEDPLATDWASLIKVPSLFWLCGLSAENLTPQPF